MTSQHLRAISLIALLPAIVAEARGATATTTAPMPGEVSIEWKTPAPTTAPAQPADAEKATKLTIAPGGDAVNVLTLEDPKITHATYAIRGLVKYEDVKGRGYLEMWSHFPDGRFFSRTLGDAGPMRAIHGTSDWREFVLPFSSSPGKFPSRLEVNVVLPEGGTVWLGEAKLVQPAGDLSRRAGAWWSDRQGGIFGGVLGSTLGIIGGLIGALAGLGRGRRLALSLALASAIASAVLLVTGIAALGLRQPYGVWYPLVLCGALGTIILGSLYPTLKRRFAEHELRRMSAVDVAG